MDNMLGAVDAVFPAVMDSRYIAVEYNTTFNTTRIKGTKNNFI